MKWIEIITLRSLVKANRQLVDELFEHQVFAFPRSRRKPGSGNPRPDRRAVYGSPLCCQKQGRRREKRKILAGRVPVWSIPTNEELMIARHTRRLIE